MRRIGDHVSVATRVIDTFDEKKTIFERVDNDFPRDAQGQIDWSY
jgi:hypothetical protein